MKKEKDISLRKENTRRTLRLMAPLVVLFAVVLVLLPRGGKFDYDYRKGSPWMHETLKAEVDFPILKTEEQLMREREALGSEIVPYYRYADETASQVRTMISAVELGEYESVKQSVLSAVSDVYADGVLPDMTGSISNASDRLILVQKGKRAEKTPCSAFFTVSQARSTVVELVGSDCPDVKVDSLLSASGILSMIVPDLVFDKETTELVHQKSVDYISPTSGMVERGTTIVENGEIVTDEIKQQLDSYSVEFNRSVGYNGPVALMWLGNVMMAFILVLLLFLSIYFANKRVLDDYNRYIYLVMVFMLSAVATLVVDACSPKYIYLVPYSLMALYLMAFFKKRVVMPTYILSLLPVLLCSQNGPELFIVHLFAGMVCIFTYRYFNRGWLQFVNALCIFIAAAVAWYMFKLINGSALNVDYFTLLWLFLGSFFCVAGYPLIFLFEKIFNLVSDSRLQELSDTNNELLIDLQKKAPGTFQHCLQVMNLSDAAARSIGANVLLTRAGALYHDIGKMANPLCFVENQVTDEDKKYHSRLTPAESAQAIISHVTYGKELAEKKHLPEAVRRFITTHHGTTDVEYFLTKYLNGGGDPANVAVFNYAGENPESKEESIVMICDTLEAASRTLPDFSRETVNKFVDSIVAKKMSQGQLWDSLLTQHDIAVIKETLKEYICNVHHGRISYPKRRF